MMAADGCGNSPPAGKSATAKSAAAAKAGPAGLGNTGGAPVTAIRFDDVTVSAGVSFTYRDGRETGYYSILESLGGGAAAVDYDGDGDVDLFVSGGGELTPERETRGNLPAAFRNDGDWRFTRIDRQALFTAAPYYNHGLAGGDYDDDGFPDLLMTGYGGLVFYKNQGDGTFVEATRESKLLDELWSSSAAWGDLNGDGLPDLYVAHYVNWSFDNNPVCKSDTAGQRDTCSPKSFEALPHALYVNCGDGTFRNASSEAGLRTDGKGLGVLLADLDLDGRLDIYVANDTTPKFLYRNHGELKFEEVGLESGAGLNDRGDPDGSMGLDVFDYNLDGLPDLWVTNFEHESFAVYRNQGNWLFRHVSRISGIMAIGGLYVGWGTAASDFDRDGDEDLFVTNGHATRFSSRSAIRQLPLVFENLGNGRFANVATGAGPCLGVPHLGRGLAAADFDDDGDLDLALTPINEPALLLANVSQTPHHWLALKLIGTTSSRDAVGALISVETPHGRIIRQVKGGGSYASTSDSRVFFGLGAASSISRLEIRWPSGLTQGLENVTVDRLLRIVEPRYGETVAPVAEIAVP
jgi:hypothetical protein